MLCLKSAKMASLSVVILAMCIAPGAQVSAQQLTVSNSGNTINATISASLTGTIGHSCCLSLSLDYPFPTGGACTDACGNAPLHGSWSCNAVGQHTVTGCWLGSETNYQYTCTTQSITIGPLDHAQPSPGCPLFDLTAGTKVLTHLYNPNDTYPNGQVQDAQMPLTIRARRADPGTTIYLQVTDPPDSSQYGGPHTPDDNVDVSGTVGTIAGSKQVTMTLPPSGQSTTLTLQATDYAAGDNYRVKGSIDPQLLTNPSFQCSDCPDTGVITAWKRVYLETDKMFRKGTFVTQDALAGDTQVHVADLTNFVAPKGKTPGSSVVLVHAPTLGKGPVYYEPSGSEPPLTVAKIDKKKLLLTISRPLARTYHATDDPTKPWRADGVGVVSGIPSVDFFTPNTSLTTALYASSFIEIVPSSTSDPGYVPYSANLTNPQATDLIEAGWRWCRAYGQPNRLCVIGGAKSGTNPGVRVKGEPVSWTWVSQIESLVASSNAPTLNAESTAHEFTHAWDVNQGFNMNGHCAEEAYYQNHNLFCLMHADWSDMSGNVLPQFFDGVVGFHYDVGLLFTPSEYLEVRQHQEPLP